MVKHSLKSAEVAMTLPLVKCGPDSKNWEFQAEDQSCAFYIRKPDGRQQWAWNFEVFAGDDRFDATRAPLLTICRRKAKTPSARRFEGQDLVLVNNYNEVVTKMDWLDKNTYSLDMYVPASCRKFAFSANGQRFVWKTKNTLMGIDHICRDVATGRMVAHFSNTFLPVKQEGKLHISKEVPSSLVVVLLATCLAYREWNKEVDTVAASAIAVMI